LAITFLSSIQVQLENWPLFLSNNRWPRRRFINGSILKTPTIEECNVTTQNIATLAAALKADILSTDQPSTLSSSVECFLCGRTYTYQQPTGDDSGRFCRDKCRDDYDAGYRRPEPLDPFKLTNWRVVAGGDPGRLPSTPMRRGSEGWYITCPGCQREFESKGLRCCSTACERRLCEHDENTALMAEVGMEPEAKPKCSVPGCDNSIPKWRNGRRVSKRARFCDRHSRHSKKRASEALIRPKNPRQAAK
jgi:hypothetical protein